MSEDLLLTVRLVGDVPVVEATGEIDLTTTMSLDAALVQALSENPPTVVLDLGGVSFLDSSGLATLVATHKATRQKGGELRLVNPSDRVDAVLRVSGLDRVFPVYSSVEAAARIMSDH